MITEQDHDDVQCGFTETELEWHSSASLDEERAPSLATTTSVNDCACAQGHHIKDTLRIIRPSLGSPRTRAPV